MTTEAIKREANKKVLIWLKRRAEHCAMRGVGPLESVLLDQDQRSYLRRLRMMDHYQWWAVNCGY